MTDYPRRDSHFAHKIVRLMLRTCAAQEIGVDAMLLVTAIAHTEDAKRYTSPVTYWNQQLQSILAFGSWGKLDRARKKAVEAGWLHYDGGRKGNVAKYWALIPSQFSGLPDDPLDEDYPGLISTSGEQSGGENEVLRSKGGEPTGDKVVNQPGTNRGQSGEPSSLRPKPTPKPTPKRKTSSSCSEEPQAAPAEPTDSSKSRVVLTYRTVGKGKTTWNLTQAKLDEYVESFPGVNVLVDLRMAVQWCEDNQQKRKTPNGMPAFLTRWLTKTQNQGGGGGRNQGTQSGGQAVRSSDRGRVRERDWSDLDKPSPEDAPDDPAAEGGADA